MKKNEIRVYGGKIWGNVPVSKYGLEHGYLDYQALANMVEHRIPNNIVRDRTECEWESDWEVINGTRTDMIFQDYIISELGATILYDLTDELVFYNPDLDLYIWSVDHTGTAWDYVLTDVKLITEGAK